jgi:hypothetical protein
MTRRTKVKLRFALAAGFACFGILVLLSWGDFVHQDPKGVLEVMARTLFISALVAWGSGWVRLWRTEPR